MQRNTVFKKKNTHSATEQPDQSENVQVKSDLRFISSANLCIIREMFKMINYKEVPMPDFYAFLAGSCHKDELDRFIDGFNHAVRGNGDVKRFSRILTKYGISKEYFADRPMVADGRINAAFAEYCKGQDTVTLAECQQVLSDNLFSVKNLDGTLVIDSLKRILMDMQHINKDDSPELFGLAEELSQLEPNSYLSQNQLRRYYNSFAQNYKKNGYGIPDLPQKDSGSKNIYSSEATAYKIRDALLLIREAYLMLASIDGLENPLEKFYACIGISEDEYDSMLSSGQVDAKKLFRALAPYKFPASLFRGNSATTLHIDSGIETALSNFRNGNISLEDFRLLLKLNLFYRVNPEDFLFFIAVYSLYNKIAQNS